MLKVHLVYCFFSMKKKNLKPLRNLAFRDVEAKTVRKFVTSTSVISNDEDVVVICWVPGLVCVVHILSHYRLSVCISHIKYTYFGTFNHIQFFNKYL